MQPRPLREILLAGPLASALVASLTTLLLVGTLGAAKGGHRRVIELLEGIDAKLDATHPPAASDPVFALELCVKGAVGGEGGYGAETALRVEGEGRVGAEAFGNGLMAKLRALPGAKLEGGVKGEIGGELTACFDLLALLDRSAKRAGDSELSPRARQTFQRLAAVNQTQLLEAAAAFADATTLDAANFPAALDEMRQLPAALDPAAFGSGENLVALAGVLPLPAQQRALLENPASFLAAFQEHQGLCGLQGLPPRLAEVVDQACLAAANEPLENALMNVQTRVTAVQGTVGSIASAVASIPARVVDAICDVIPGC